MPAANRQPLSCEEEIRIQNAVDAIGCAIANGLYANAATFAAYYDREALVTAEIAARVGDVWREHSGIATVADTPHPTSMPGRTVRQTDDPWGTVA